MATEALADGLRRELAARTADLSRQSAVNQDLAARLSESDRLLAALRGELETERRRAEEERLTSIQQVTDALTRADGLQATLDTREREHAQTLAEQKGRYEALIAELVTTANDQQTEYQHLLEQMTAAQEEQHSRAERHEAELAQHHAAAQQQLAESEACRRELEARLETAEALCAAHDARCEELRHQAENLVSTLASPLPGFSQPDQAPLALETGTDTAQAVA